MGAVKKYCNKAILIEDGYIKAQGEPDEVANQYSYDNANTEKNDDGKTVEKLVVDNLEVNLLLLVKLHQISQLSSVSVIMFSKT